MTEGHEPRYLDAGETGLVVEFGHVIDEAVNNQVLALDAALTSNLPKGVIELVPTYRSLMVHYDPLIVQRSDLVVSVRHALTNCVVAKKEQSRLWRLPACYEGPLAQDLAYVSSSIGLSEAETINRHARARYRVFMYGFSPGWAYLGGLPKELALPRRPSPRDQIPAGSLIIAAGQAIVASLAMPSGWHILGRTPERLFSRERVPAFLISVGDLITFDPIDRPTFDALELRVLAGETLARLETLP